MHMFTYHSCSYDLTDPQNREDLLSGFFQKKALLWVMSYPLEVHSVIPEEAATPIKDSSTEIWKPTGLVPFVAMGRSHGW